MTRSLRKNQDFMWFITGQTVSQFGTAMTTFVIPWLLLQITGSALQTGIAFAVGFVPYLLISLPAGVWADRFNRKMLMRLADLGRLLLLLSIPLTHLTLGTTPLFLLYVTQAGVSGLSAVFDAAYSSCLPQIVDSAQLREANNALQTGRSLSRILGPIFGGMAVAWVATANLLLVDVFSYVISIVSLYAISQSFSETIIKHSNQTFSKDIREGITTIWNIKPVLYLMLFATLINLVGPGMDVALLYRIQHELHLRSQWAGIIMTGLSGGMVLGSLINRWIGKHIEMGTWLTLSTFLQVFPPIVLMFTKDPFMICLIQIFIGVLLVAWNVQSATLRQTLIPVQFLGRCSSVFRFSAWISIPLGDGLAGVISQAQGTRVYFLLAACVLATVPILAIKINLRHSISSVSAQQT